MNRLLPFSVLTCLGALLSVMAIGCDSATYTVDAENDLLTAVGADFHQLTLDEQFLRASEDVPGFGGLFIDDSGVVIVVLTDESRVNPESCVRVKKV